MTVGYPYVHQFELEKAQAKIKELESRLAQVDMKRPFLAVDIVCFTPAGLVLIERKWPPLGWALPGGHVDYGESCEDAAVREMKEETGLDIRNLQLICINSDPNRDPRKHTISVSYIAEADGVPVAADDAANVIVVPKDKIPSLCFDHDVIIQRAFAIEDLWRVTYGTYKGTKYEYGA